MFPHRAPGESSKIRDGNLCSFSLVRIGARCPNWLTERLASEGMTTKLTNVMMHVVNTITISRDFFPERKSITSPSGRRSQSQASHYWLAISLRFLQWFHGFLQRSVSCFVGRFCRVWLVRTTFVIRLACALYLTIYPTRLIQFIAY